MPIETVSAVNIVCDNPACPGNTLDPHDRVGWTFVNTEIYGQTGQQFVYCCAMCAGTVKDVITETPLAEMPMMTEMSTEPATPEVPA
jgi:hypothetical protein